MKFQALHNPDSRWWYWNPFARCWFDIEDDVSRATVELLRQQGYCICRRKAGGL